MSKRFLDKVDVHMYAHIAPSHGTCQGNTLLRLPPRLYFHYIILYTIFTQSPYNSPVLLQRGKYN